MKRYKSKGLFTALAVLTGFLAGTQARAGVVTYTDSGSFDAAAGSILTQSFNFLSDTIGGSGIGTDSNGINSTTNDAYITPGQILPGLSISASTNNGPDLALSGPNFDGFGLTNYAVFGNYPGSSLDFSLNPGVTAFSLGVLDEFSSAAAEVDVYDPSSNLLGSFILNNPPPPTSGTGEFFGITTTLGDTIGSVVLTSGDAPFVGVDQIQFSGSGTPEPGTVTMLAMGILGLGALVRRQQQR